MLLEQNIKGLCTKFGIKFNQFLDDLDVDDVNELTLYDLEAVCEEYNIDLMSLLFKPMFRTDLWNKKLNKISLLVLDVDGVMTDGGMYFTENGDHIKKYNTKDGMAIQHLVKMEFQVAVISSGFMEGVVNSRCKMLGIQHCEVTREPKIEVLTKLCEKLGIALENVAVIGDDINDLEMIHSVGFSACPSDAVPNVKTNVDVILTKKGGDGCVREFIDSFLLKQPI
jgi:3-deoxy-D-manno-octulosonate 8-phosphate phosphatase (KDO 8-P phosphatase)